VAWLNAQQSHHFFISVMTIAEIQQGIELVRDQDADRASSIEAWLIQELIAGGQVLTTDAEVARAWAKLMHKRSNTLFENALIAATATVHRLAVATRNMRDFKALGVACVDPFAYR
jgi:toxin FitB